MRAGSIVRAGVEGSVMRTRPVTVPIPLYTPRRKGASDGLMCGGSVPAAGARQNLRGHQTEREL